MVLEDAQRTKKDAGLSDGNLQLRSIFFKSSSEKSHEVLTVLYMGFLQKLQRRLMKKEKSFLSRDQEPQLDQPKLPRTTNYAGLVIKIIKKKKKNWQRYAL